MSAPAPAAAAAPRICIGNGCTITISRTSKGRCRSCAAKRLSDDPDIKARRIAAQDAYFARPEVKDILRARIAKTMETLSDEEIERRRAHGRNMVATKLHTPEAQAKALATRMQPEVRARRGRSVTRTRLPWLPDHLIEAYRELTRSGMRAAEARAALEPEIPGTAAHTARVLANFTDAQRIRQERDRAQAY